MASGGGVGGKLRPGGATQRSEAQQGGGGCKGCLATKVIDMVKTVGDLAAYVVGEAATQEEQDRRKAVCEGCTATDSIGDRLYRQTDQGPTCGVPRLSEMLRDSTVDGCGCYLKQKWSGKSQSCPLGKW